MKNELTDKFAKDVSKDVVNLVISLFKKIGKFAQDEIKIRNATDLYAENYVRRYGQVKILAMPKPFLLKDLYTEVYITNPYRTKEQYLSTLNYDLRNPRDDFHLIRRRISGLKMANQENKLNVLGAPGSGKSTFLRKIGLESLTFYNYPVAEKYEPECIPVLIELKKFKAEEVDLKSLIQKEFEIANFPESSRFVERSLKDGKLLILLDGLDEVPEAKLDETLSHLKDFTDKYYKNRFITSCRTAYYKGYLTGFTDVEITSFTNEQIRQFVNNWFSLEMDADAGTSELFQNLLFAETNESTLELARTPLLLAFLCMSFDYSQRFPINKASLFKQALQILMHRWAAEKRIHNEDINQDLNIEVETEMLADLAAYFFRQDKILFETEEVSTRIKEFLSDRIAPLSLNVSKILEAIEIQQGILMERIPNNYSFSHLTIQEYLTAHYYHSPIRIHELIENYLFNKNWREVFLLLVGSGDPNDILEIIILQIKKFVQTHKVVYDTVDWVQSQLKSTRDQQTICHRIFLASILIRFKRYDGSFPNKPERLEIYANELIQRVNPPFFDFFVYDLSENINKKQANYLLVEINKWLVHSKNINKGIEKISSLKPVIPFGKLSPGSRQTFRRQILDEFYQTLEVPMELRNKRRTYYTPLLKYMEAFSLLLDCAKESSLTTKQTLQHIYDSIFTLK